MTVHAQRFPARMTAFPTVAAFVEAACHDAGFESADALRLRLVLEELFTNTVSHGHCAESDQPVDITLDVTPGSIRVTYEDTGPAFDPRASGPAHGPAAHPPPVGRLGLILVRRIARDLAYERVEGRNRLSLSVHSSTDPRLPPRT
jgi:serine/threonine-protein kinase RsbW